MYTSKDAWEFWSWKMDVISMRTPCKANGKTYKSNCTRSREMDDILIRRSGQSNGHRCQGCQGKCLWSREMDGISMQFAGTKKEEEIGSRKLDSESEAWHSWILAEENGDGDRNLDDGTVECRWQWRQRWHVRVMMTVMMTVTAGHLVLWSFGLNNFCKK